MIINYYIPRKEFPFQIALENFRMVLVSIFKKKCIFALSFYRKLPFEMLILNFLLNYIRNIIGQCSLNNREQKNNLETFSSDFGKNSSAFGKMPSTG